MLTTTKMVMAMMTTMMATNRMVTKMIMMVTMMTIGRWLAAGSDDICGLITECSKAGCRANDIAALCELKLLGLNSTNTIALVFHPQWFCDDKIQ